MLKESSEIGFEYQVVRAAGILKLWEPAPLELENFPWRKERTPYRIFLAEFLLVRTRADIVSKYFDQTYLKFPDISHLAESELGEIEHYLKPLGLYKRAFWLKSAAKFILENFNGQVPSDINELLSVPGIGLYTAAAIRAFAFGTTEVPADVNIYRFISRITGLPMKHPTRGSVEIRELLPFLSEQSGGPSSEKLLDFTRKICRPQRPRCRECPLVKVCIFGIENTE